MTQRERQTPGAGAAAPARAAGPAADSLHAPPVRNVGSGLWEELFHRAGPEQQQELLTLAGRQGLVYAHQVAANSNGHAVVQPPRRTLLPSLLNGQTKELEAVRPLPLETLDTALDPWQREAVARAVQTPDICLIQGTPGTGKSRVIAEIIVQATRRGGRVLFVAPATAALDRVLEQLAGNDDLCPVRCVASDESLESLPADIRRSTIAERQRHFQEQTLYAASQAADGSRSRWEATRSLETTFAELDSLAAAHQHTVAELAALAEAQAALSAAVTAEMNGTPAAPSALQAQWAERSQVRAEAAANIAARLAVRRTERDKCRAEGERVAAELRPLAPLHEAHLHNRWWSAAWWRARGETDLPTRVANLQARCQALENETKVVQQDVEKLEAEQRHLDDDYRTEEHRLRDEEVKRRQAEIDAKAGKLAVERNQIEERWRRAAATVEGVSPEAVTAAALPAARERWAARLHAEHQQHQAADAWARAVADAMPTLPQQLAACANVVAATMNSLATDPYFGDRSGVSFDLLILDEAELVSESEFVNVARRSGRWVLVGQPVPDVDSPAAFARRSPSAKPLRPAALRPGFFQRLWHTLHGDPRRLPYAWARRDGRLSCGLHPVPVDHRQFVETEPIADRPEIELRIVAPPRRPSYLAEVVFPGTTTAHEAKQYIFRELGELSVQAHGHSLRWSECPEHFTLNLSAAVDPDAMAVELEPGVCELVGTLPGGTERDTAPPWHTCALAFDRQAGWTLERATQWVETHLKARDLGRTAYLATPYRMHGRLAQVLDDLLFEELNHLDCPRYRCLASQSESVGGSRPVEFVAVPAGFMDVDPRHHSEPSPAAPGEGTGDWGGSGGTTVATRPRAVKGGAGLEIDLADPRRLDPLPPEFRRLLPADGLVNYLEAQVVVRALEQLVADPALRGAGTPGNQPAVNGTCASASGCTPPRHGPVVAVVALYPAQAALLALLIQRSAVIAAGDVRVEVGTPATFRQRECLVALVSLTRSHAHRAVSFGHGPEALALALTRAAVRVVLVGDPGTLWRRSQWNGEIDHLEEADALRERDLAARLVRYIQGHGAHAHAFQLREGAGK